MRRPLSASLAALALCATAALWAADDEVPFERQIAGGKADEVCLELRTGQTWHWEFRSDGALDFNLHTHVGQQVVMPVEMRSISGHRGSHQAQENAAWCLMWTAPAGRAVQVKGSHRLTGP